MQEETKDQVTEEAPKTEAPTGPKVIKKEQAPKVQSETTKEEVKAEVKESKVYKVKLPDGERDMTPDELYEHYQKIGPEFTRRSQELAELKRQAQETNDRNKKSAEEQVSSSKLLEDVDPTVRAAIVSIVSPVIQEALTAKERLESEKRANEAFNKRMDDLAGKYGKKFDKIEILRKMQEPGNEIYDPEVLYQKLHWDEYLDEQIKAAMKGKSSGTQSESTGGDAQRKPMESKTPKTWAEASKAAISRM